MGDFLDTNPTDVYNPYPQIARRDNLRQARTQPLVRIRYQSFDGVFETGADDDFVLVSNSLQFFHERAHLNNDIPLPKASQDICR
jgi:hypothetical protein